MPDRPLLVIMLPTVLEAFPRREPPDGTAGELHEMALDRAVSARRNAAAG